MRQTIRLAYETLEGIKILKQAYEKEFNGLKLNQGYVVSKAYIDTDSKSKSSLDWKNIIEAPLSIGAFVITDEHKESRTTLDLSEDVMNGIDEMKQILPDVVSANWVTIGYCIRLIVKAGLLKLKEDNKI